MIYSTGFRAEIGSQETKEGAEETQPGSRGRLSWVFFLGKEGRKVGGKEEKT